MASPIVAADTQPRKINVVGYDVVEPLSKAKGILSGLYGEILSALEEIPPTAGYRQIVEATTKHRLRVVNEESSYEGIETRIGTGVVEELIEQAQDELQLIPKVAEWKPWVLPEGHVAQVGPSADVAKQIELQAAGSNAKPAQKS
jgi:NADH dehydrogenase (ubiquinone) 1 alpha subcomplex subunit 5